MISMDEIQIITDLTKNLKYQISIVLKMSVNLHRGICNKVAEFNRHAVCHLPKIGNLSKNSSLPGLFKQSV